MESMKENQVWDLVDLPPEPQTISKKWELFLRLNARWTDLLKGIRLALWLRALKEGIDYEDTFPPVLRLVSIRLILAILAHMDLELYQMFKLHFLMGILMKRSIWTNPSALWL
jgi:hypothetical protein